MARKRTTSALPPREAVFAAARAAAEDGRWGRVTLRGLSEAANVPFCQVYALFRSPADVVAGLLADALDAAIADALPDASLSPKDRIFDAAMNVFDALKPHRAGIAGMLAAYRWKP